MTLSFSNIQTVSTPSLLQPMPRLRRRRLKPLKKKICLRSLPSFRLLTQLSLLRPRTPRTRRRDAHLFRSLMQRTSKRKIQKPRKSFSKLMLLDLLMRLELMQVLMTSPTQRSLTSTSLRIYLSMLSQSGQRFLVSFLSVAWASSLHASDGGSWQP